MNSADEQIESIIVHRTKGGQYGLVSHMHRGKCQILNQMHMVCLVLKNNPFSACKILSN